MPFFSAAAMYCASAMHAGSVDRHRRRDVAHVDAVEEHLHVGERVDRDAALADFAARLRRVGVVSHQRRHVERHREAVLAVLEQEMIAFVGLARRAEAGELAHRPKPIAIAVGVNAARIRIFTRPREVARQIEMREIASDRRSS